MQVYIHRVLKEVHPDLSLSNRAISVLDGFTKDLRERITLEASQLCRVHNKATLSSREVSTPLCLRHLQCQCRSASSNMMFQDAVRAGQALPVLRTATDGSCMSAAATNAGWRAIRISSNCLLRRTGPCTHAVDCVSSFVLTALSASAD